jgi:predicted dehydrogenase
MKKLNFAILGAGNIAKSMAKAASGIKDEITPYAIAARDLDRAEKLRSEYGFTKSFGSYEEMVQDPGVDIVYIATVKNLHHEHSKLCLEHGKHVLCEKSFTINAKEAEDLFRIAKERNLFIGEAMWTRFFPSVLAAQKMVADGVIGEVRSLKAAFSFPFGGGSSMLTDPALGGGALLDLGIYPLTFADIFLGQDIEKIVTTGKLQGGIDVEDTIELYYKNGAAAHLRTGMKKTLLPNATIEGTEGKLKFALFWATPSFTLITGGKRKKIKYPFDVNGYEYEVRGAIKAINEGRLYCEEITWEKSLYMMRLMDRLRKEWGLVYPFEKE